MMTSVQQTAVDKLNTIFRLLQFNSYTDFDRLSHQNSYRVIRERFPDVNAGQHDIAFSVSSANVYTVTWNEFVAATWPKPPNSCKDVQNQCQKKHIN